MIILIDIRTKIEEYFHDVYLFIIDNNKEEWKEREKNILELPKGQRRAARLNKLKYFIATQLFNHNHYLEFIWVGDGKGYWVYKFEGKLYKDVKLTLTQFIRSFFMEYNEYPKPTDIEEVIQLIKEDSKTRRNLIDDDKSADYINFKNGHISLDYWNFLENELQTMEENGLENTAEFEKVLIKQDESVSLLEFIQIPWQYKPDLPDPTFLIDEFKFLAQNEGSEEAIQNWVDDMQEILGFMMCNKVNLKKMVWFVDECGKQGDSAKSFIIKIIRYMIGDENCTEQELQEFSNGNFSKWDIADAHLVYYNDLSEKEMENIGRIKNYVDHDVFTYIPKYGKSTTIFNSKKFIYGMQRLLYIKKSLLDTALTGRIKFMFFRYTIPKDIVDRDYFDKHIKGNTELMEQIVCWSVKGLKRLMERGHFLRADKHENLKLWKYNIDYVFRFIEDCCVKTTTSHTTSADMYKIYKKWLVEVGSEQNITARVFNKRVLENLGYNDNDKMGKKKSNGYDRFVGLDIDYENEFIESICCNGESDEDKNLAGRYKKNKWDYTEVKQREQETEFMTKIIDMEPEDEFDRIYD